jgi:hypothetical protein
LGYTIFEAFGYSLKDLALAITRPPQNQRRQKMAKSRKNKKHKVQRSEFSLSDTLQVVGKFLECAGTPAAEAEKAKGMIREAFLQSGENYSDLSKITVKDASSLQIDQEQFAFLKPFISISALNEFYDEPDEEDEMDELVAEDL